MPVPSSMTAMQGSLWTENRTLMVRASAVIELTIRSANAASKVAYECMFWHNSYPRIPAGDERANSVPAYLDPIPEGIDCQRCHGPGGGHVRVAQAQGARQEDIRRTMVNPARLSGDRQMEVCMQCHLQTTSLRLPAAIRRFDRGPFSYHAGQPLSGFLLFFDRAAVNCTSGRGREPAEV